ncbi:hypothetical protein G6F57_014672 [Rhizopus arrhizus]|nr:hypothetical protein G6F57_014672 [Rhizopus arrhizus]
MSYTSLLLVILAAMAHATWNLLAKRAAMVGAPFVFAYGLCASVLYAPWVIWVLMHDGMTWTWPVVAAILTSSLLHLGYSLCLQRGYQVADLSVVYPLPAAPGPCFPPPVPSCCWANLPPAPASSACCAW